MTADRLFLLDCMAQAYRAHFAFIKNPLTNGRGMTTSAVFGFARELVALLDRERPDAIAVVTDGPRPTFRHERFPAYKATRERMPDDMQEQLPYIERLVRALAIPYLMSEGYEEDDLIGTLARRGEAAGYEVFLVTPDKDFMQLVSPTVHLYRFRRGLEPEVLGAAAVEEKFGVGPGLVADVLGLMGDASDNIPGVPGVGEKTARRLIEEFGDLDAVLVAAAEGRVKQKRLRALLVEHAEQARLSRDLATIRTDVPHDLDLAALRQGEPDRGVLLPLLKDLEFQGLYRRFAAVAPAADAGIEARYRVVTTDAEAAEVARRLAVSDAFVFDTETTGLRALEARLVGLAVCDRPGEAFYIPANVPGGEERILGPFKALLEDPGRPKGAQNAKFDLQVLRNHGIEVRGLAFDTMVESHLVDPTVRHNLDAMALRLLDHRKIPTEELIGKGKTQRSMAEVPVEEVGPYACEDADYTLRVHEVLHPQVEALGLADHLREVEVPLVEVIGRMERTGVRIDVARLGEMRVEMVARLDALTEEIHGLAGETFNIASPKQLGPVLFDRLRIQDATGSTRKLRRTRTGDYATDQETLDIYAEHPMVQKVLEYRRLAKLKGTYVEALPELVSPATGRIHASFHQTGTATGRLSSSDPNLQNIPVRGEVGRRIREAFIAGEPDWRILAADYSQIELRVLAHMAGEGYLQETYRRGGDVHVATAALVFGLEPGEVSRETRDRAKAINFGIIYGMGAQRLGRETGLSLGEAQDFIARYFEKLPAVKRFIDERIAFARREGYVQTLSGRRRPLPEIHSKNPGLRVNAENIAVNTPIQGTAADLMKRAMVEVDRRLRVEGLRARMLIQVHDELVFESPSDEVDALTVLVREAMEGVARLDVPLVVDVGVGANWLEAK